MEHTLSFSKCARDNIYVFGRKTILTIFHALEFCTQVFSIEAMLSKTFSYMYYIKCVFYSIFHPYNEITVFFC